MIKTARRRADDEFATFFREFVAPVRGYVRTLVIDSEVEGIVSATFATAWAKFDTVPLLSQKAWLFGVARNHARNHVRAGGRRAALVGAIADLRPEEGVTLFAGRLDATEVQPLLEALDRLSADEREVIQLAVWHELQPAQIAEVLGIDAQVGSLEPGKFADFVVVEPRSPDVGPLWHPLETYVLSTSLRNLKRVYVGGMLVSENGVSTNPLAPEHGWPA